jgi:hypothetical protein
MSEKNHINILSLALAIGTLWAGACLLLGILAWLFNWGTSVVEMLSSLYIGYKPTLPGSVIGTIWAFVDGFVAGAVIAWLYNFFQKIKKETT